MKRPSTGRSQLRQAYSLTPFRDSAARGDSRELQDRLRYVAIADTEQAYAMRLMTFLDSSGRIPFDTRVFTEPAGAVRAMQEEEILILVASQSFYSLMLGREMGGTYSLPGEERMPGAERPAPPPVMILAEEGGTCGEGVTVVSKYQAMEGIELEILKLLIGNPGRVFSPKEIYGQVWHDIPLGSDNTVAVHIRHLREKLEINPAEPRYLKVVWGQGYKLEDRL